MKINCLECGHTIEISDAYDDYEGQVKCWVCAAMLEIKTEEGCLKAMKLPATGPRVPVEEETLVAP